jgi:hypothetical protein
VLAGRSIQAAATASGTNSGKLSAAGNGSSIMSWFAGAIRAFNQEL